MIQNISSASPLRGPRPMPILGARGNKLHFRLDPIAYHRSVYQTYGTLAAFVEGGSKVLTYDPEYNRQVMSQPQIFQVDRVALPGPPNSALHRLGVGLNTLNGELHRQRRQMFMPAFHKRQIESYCEEMVASTQGVLDRWQIGHVYDIGAEMRAIALSVTCKILFDIDPACWSKTLAPALERWLTQATSFSSYLLPFEFPGSPYLRLLQLADDVEVQLMAMIAERRGHTEGRHDVFSVLLQTQMEDGSNLTSDELIGEITLFFMAGFETTAAALTWILFLLSQHPAVLADLVDELQGLLHGAAPTAAQLGSLPLLDAVIKEGMRVLPPAIQGGRIGVEPFAFGAHEFPAGTKVMYSQYMTHHLPDLYPLPERFLPERWATINPSPYEYLPFLAGPRMCIGTTFAQVEMKIVLAMILQRFRLEPPPHARVDRTVKVTLSPKNGMPMVVLPQDRHFAKVPVLGNIHEMVDLL